MNERMTTGDDAAREQAEAASRAVMRCQTFAHDPYGLELAMHLNREHLKQVTAATRAAADRNDKQK